MQRGGDRNDPADFVLDVHVTMLRPGGIAADVQHVGACGNKLPGLRQRCRNRVGRPGQAVPGKGVRRDVENTHDLDALTPVP